MQNFEVGQNSVVIGFNFIATLVSFYRDKEKSNLNPVAGISVATYFLFFATKLVLTFDLTRKCLSRHDSFMSRQTAHMNLKKKHVVT